ncbi:hypothetical protein [Hymenobacter sp. B81]|uniref:hypothetical protein n=1 Tax=Hymenobacter sp. B81 TaxID=3344878 RepID=UPI0037DDCF67
MEKTDPVFELFQQEVSRHGLVIDSVSEDGLIYIKDHRISLDNARKQFTVNGDTSKVQELVRLVLNSDSVSTSWEEVRAAILPVLLPSDMEYVQEAVHKRITAGMSMVLVQNAGEQIVWLRNDDAAEWKQTHEMLFKEAYANLDSVLASSEIKPALLEGHPYGIILGAESFLDASLPFAPGFKERVKKQFGWPVYAVMPVRDLCFIFSEHELDFFGQRFSSTVLTEFSTSPYPVTRELIKISDSGIEAIGQYKKSLK